LLDGGAYGQAAASATQAAQTFEKTKAAGDEAAAHLLLAEALLAEGRIAESRKNVEEVVSVARKTHNRGLELSGALIAARVRATSGNSADVHESIAGLTRVAAEATAEKFARLAIEARLAIGEIQMSFGDRAAGRALLETLEKESSNQGFLVISRRAAAALRAGAGRA